MTYPAVQLKLAVADHFLRHLHSLPDETLELAITNRCPSSCTQAITTATDDTQALRSDVAHIAALLHDPTDPPAE